MIGESADKEPRQVCRICRLARIHVFLVLVILALWRFNPSLFAWAGETDRYLVPALIVTAIVGLFVYKWWGHYRG
jgi:disulfide bond formation protein DsbB